MASGPDLFVVCKNCGSQVSPYVTECPYCGSRLRKRAPKIERPRRPGDPEGATKRQRRRGREGKPSLGPLRTGEIPGIRGDETRRPYATIALVAIGALLWLALIPLREAEIGLFLAPLESWAGILVAPFLHLNGWHQFVALVAVGLFGWLLERRHGPVVVVALWLLAASGGLAVVRAVAGPEAIALGATGGALALLCAWAVPHLRARRAGEDSDDADLVGTGVLFVLLALMPLARPEVSVLATVVGIAVGALAGLALARISPR